MTWTGWNNGAHHRSGAGYGLKVDSADRDRHFRRTWQRVTVKLPSKAGAVVTELNVAKKSFWGEQCRELISKDIGGWLLGQGYAPWGNGERPKFEVEQIADRRFRLVRRVAA